MDHLLTFGGHPVAAAAAVKNLEIFADEDLVDRGAEMGRYLGSRLEELRSHPTVGDVRGTGLLWAIELVTSKQAKTKWGRDHAFTKRANQALLERGIVSRTWEVMHFAPPLVVNREEIDRLVTAADEVLSLVEQEFAGEITD